MLGRTKPGREVQITELLFSPRDRPDDIARQWYRGVPKARRPNWGILGLSEGQRQVVLPAKCFESNPYVQIGLCSVDGIVRDVQEPNSPAAEQSLFSDVQWAAVDTRIGDLTCVYVDLDLTGLRIYLEFAPAGGK